MTPEATNATLRTVDTCLGQLVVERRGEFSPDVPVLVFLHGIFLDRTLWTELDEDMPPVGRLYIDMPGHGDSADVGRDWTLTDCVDALAEVLSTCHVTRCVLVGHSWGAMVSVRAAARGDKRIAGLALFNMPHRRVSGLARLGFRLQKLVTWIPRFYAAQAAKSLFGVELLRRRPDLVSAMQDRLAIRPARELNRVLDAVLLEPGDADLLLENIDAPTHLVVGENDYVGLPEDPIPDAVTKEVVAGGHVTPASGHVATGNAVHRVLNAAIAQGLPGQAAESSGGSQVDG